jgi:hypothetical protein
MISFQEDESHFEDFSSFVSDIDGDDLILNYNESENITITIDGFLVDMTATPNWNGNEQIIFTIDDLQGRAVDSDTMIVTVTPVNDNPEIISVGNQFTYEDEILTIQLVANDVDGDNVTFEASTDNPELVTLQLNLNELILIPSENSFGEANIFISANDGFLTDEDEFMLTIIPVNDPPIMNQIENQVTLEDTPVTTVITANDIDSDTLEFHSWSSVSDDTLSLSIMENELTIAPGLDFNGNVQIFVSVNDGELMDTTMFQLTVTPVNDAPIIELPDQFSFNEDEWMSQDLSEYIIDVDLDTLTLTASGNIDLLIEINGLIAEISATPNWYGSEQIIFTVSDSQGRDIDSDQVEIVVNPINDFPEFISNPILEAIEDQIYIYSFSANDVDEEDVLTYGVISSPEWLTYDGIQEISGIPLNENVGDFPVILTVSDGVEIVEQSFTITVMNTNDPPVFTSIPVTEVNEDELYAYMMIANDEDIGDEISFEVNILPDWLTFEAGFIITGIPENEHVGIHNVDLSATDGDTIVHQLFSITVINTNDSPVINPIPNQSIFEDSTLTLLIETTDSDGDSLIMTAESESDQIDISLTENELLMVPISNWNGSTGITVTVDDGIVSVSETFMLTVIPVNDPPTFQLSINQVSLLEDFDTPYFALILNPFDIDGDELTFSHSGDDISWIDISLHTGSGTVIFNSVSDSSGFIIIDVYADDGNGGMFSKSISIEVEPVNDLPIVDAGTDLIVNEGEEVNLDGYGYDVEGEVSYLWSSEHDEIVFNNPEISNTFFLAPDVYLNTEYLIFLTVTDSSNVEVTDSLVIFVTNLEKEDIVDLHSGWNLMSFDIDIEEEHPQIIFEEQILNENLIFITGFDQYGSNFFNPFGSPSLNTLVSIETGRGYWVKVTDPSPISQLGFPIVPDHAIHLMEGWSILGYWYEQNMTPDEAFIELLADSNLVFVTGFGEGGATFYNPTGDPELNTLTALENGHGYAIKVDEEVENFEYSIPSGLLAKQMVLNVNPDIIKTNNFMFINGQAVFENLEFTLGDKINVLSPNGLLVGEMELLEDGKLRTGAVYGDDLTTSEIDGAQYNEPLIFMYETYESDPVEIRFTGGMEWKELQLKFREIPDQFALIQNYPNPFNSMTTILYNLPKDDMINLTIFDMLGKEVITLVNEEMKAGYKSVKWDGKDQRGLMVGGGIYFYQIKTESYFETRKMILLK